MKGWHMYSKIQQLKEQGFSIRKISRMIRVSRNTIAKYWDMPPEEYSKTFTAVNKLSSLSAYSDIILSWLETYPSMTAAQVRDWLLERHKLDAAERTVRRFVSRLRQQHGIKQNSRPVRQYEAVDELPKGYQLQLDFGVKSVRDAYSCRYIKLYVAAFSLSYSRYKWGVFQDKPFTSNDLVGALYSCFDYFGAMPRQLVYDQDAILVVSENNGDIIHTQSFTAFLNETKLKTQVCKKSDPQSKGKIEAVIRFIKRNFMENRLFMNLDIWNQAFEDWLDRTGNGKIHETTKQRPREMFLEEQEHLLPLMGVPKGVCEQINERTVRKDNTVLYASNRYSVPLGTYGKHEKVIIDVKEDALNIFTITGDKIHTHPLCHEKGKLIKAASHRRETDKKIQEQLDKTIALLGEEFSWYLNTLAGQKPRYLREQLGLVVKACESFGREKMLKAVAYCSENELFSANDLIAAVKTLYQETPVLKPLNRLPVDDEKYHVKVQLRPLKVYADAAKGVRF